MFSPSEKYIALTGDASSRRYWRVDKKKQIFCHEPNELSLSQFIEIASLLKNHDVKTPEIISVNNIDKTYLQTDLGDTTLLLDLIVNKTDEFTRYKQVIDELLKIQKISNIPEFVKNRFFDEEKYFYEIDMTLNYFGEQLLSAKKTNIEQTRESFKTIVSEISQGKMVFVHRDYHSRNIMIHEGTPCIIDFQDARMGIAQYDLASLLDDCYYQVDEQVKRDLIDYYFKKAIELKIINEEENYKDFLKKYDLMVIQRSFKAIGSFSYLYKDKANPRYLKHIGFAVEKIRPILNRLNIEFKILEDYYEN